jgi:metal-sulfur cluster biosynthetic enzyme
VNLYDLGLIYRLDRAENGNVVIDMTLTAPACPVAGEMPVKVAEAVATVPGVGTVEVHLVWEPPWTKDRMSEEAKLALDMF